GPMRSRLSVIVIVIASLATGAGGAAFAVPGSAGAAAKIPVQVPAHLCPAATPGQMSCDAIHLMTKWVSGDTAKRMEAMGLARPAVTHPNIASGPAGGYSPAQLAKAYRVNAGARTRQTVAIVDAFNNPTVRADLNRFDSQYRLARETASSFKVVNQ